MASGKKTTRAILLVDKEGFIGNALLEVLTSISTVVFVSQQAPKNRKNVKSLVYRNAMPKIPNNVYTKIIIVDDGTKRTHECLPKFLEKARKDNSPLFFISTPLCLTQPLFMPLTSYPTAKLVILGDVFGYGLPAASRWSKCVEPYLRTAKTKGIIYIRGDGLQEIFPVSFAETIIRLARVLIDKDVVKISYLFAKTPVTMLSFARVLERIDPLLRIDFLKHIEKQPILPLFPHGDFLIADPYAWVADVKTYLAAAVSHDLPVVLEKEKRSRAPFFLLAVFCLFFLLLPLLGALLLSLAGGLAAMHGLSVGETGNLSSAKAFSHTSSQLFSLASKSSDVLLLETRVVGKEDIALPLSRRIASGKNLADVFDELISAYSTGISLFQSKSPDPQKDMYKLLYVVKHATNVLEHLTAEQQLPQSVSRKLTSFAAPLHIFSVTADVLPQLLGFGKKMTYLVLFQNNMELRPSGGFIGSYGITTLEKGKVTDFSIHDVYDADGQLKGHVEPPFPIRRFLPQVHWYLRDSGFDVSFPKSAAAAANFLSLETGQQVDGVIGIDVSVLQNLLKATGPVSVSQYNKTIDSKNLFQMTEIYAEKDFFPGSTQKKDFLRALTSAMQMRFSEHKVSYAKLLDALATSLSEKHILLAFPTPSLQSVFTANDWAGSLWDTKFNDHNHIADYFGLSEANLGVNKANAFLKRSVAHSVSVAPNGTLAETVTIIYVNESTAWPGGDYKQYLRVILPSGATLTRVAINGVPQSLIAAVTNPTFYERTGFIPPSGFEVASEEEEGKSIYGFFLNVPVKTATTITLSYQVVAAAIDTTNPVFYSLRYLKQPGTDPYPYTLSLTVPNGAIDNDRGMVKKGGNTATWNGMIKTDTDFPLTLSFQ